MIKTPEFWKKRTVISYLLLPFSLLYLIIHYLNIFFTKTNKISKPTICIGNFIAGGSGKTPTAIAIGKILNEINVDFAYLSRGYKGESKELLQINKNSKAKKVGDEPILLSEISKTFIAKNRFFGAKKIAKMNDIKVIIFDDGMQNSSLKYDYVIAVIDGNIGFGNGFLIPSGPMRESLNFSLKKVDLIILIGEKNPDLLKKIQNKAKNKKIIEAKIIPSNITDFNGKNLIAFSGIAYPDKFFSLLKNYNLNIVKTIGFSDHYNYKKSDIDKLFKEAKKNNAILITTKKDWVRLSDELRKKISYLDIEMEISNIEYVKEELKKLI